MSKSRIMQLLFAIMTKINIKNKRLKYSVLAILGLVLAALTQLDEQSIGQVLQTLPQASSGSSEGVMGILGDVLKLVL